MSETKHTKGPWHRDGHNLSTVIHCTAERGSPEAKHLCGDYEAIARCEGENWEANSRLIAAAPDLLEAARWCISRDDRNDSLPRPYREVLAAAISKAEGSLT